ncbi:BatA and WFA domain-containing protein [Solibacillus sp. FSL H8-0523]|uniref:vWA domain-containing protein n=1 Tax=Solibacillus sp. FSL H8-0523 TaxID=2954511 RepID=UPI003100DFB8
MMGFMQIANSWMIVFPLIVLLYYFFRKKYTKKVVSSTLFWEEAMHETKASPYIKRLQKNILLFLQLAALLLFMFALMNPYIATKELKGQQVIFVVDTSATMLAGKDEPLLEQHKRELKRLIEQADGMPMTLITTGSQPQIITRQEESSRAVLQKLNEVDITYETAQLPKSIDVVQSFIGQTATSVYVFTDALEKAALPVDSELVEWHVYGQTDKLNNVALTKFAAMQQEDSVTALVQITNEMDEAQQLKLIISNAQGTVKEEQLVIEPNATTSHVLSDLAPSGALTAMIELGDDYATDNTWSTLLQAPSMEVRLDPAMHALVQKGFTSVYDQVVFYNEEELTSTATDGLIVSNKVAYLEQKQPLLLIGRDDVEGKVVQQFAQSSNHPLFNFSALDEIYIQTLYPPFEDFETIATVDEEPFIQLSNKGDIIVLADIEETDWPLHPSFPLFLWSAIQQIGSHSQHLGTFSPLQSASIVIPQNDWSIFDEDGAFLQTISNGKQFVAPSKPGFYEMTAEEELRYFTVELGLEERSITQGETYQLGSIAGTSQIEDGHNSLMLWLVVLVLVLLFIEWEVQRRRGFTN